MPSSLWLIIWLMLAIEMLLRLRTLLSHSLTQKGLIQVLSAPARQLSLGQGSLDQGQQAAVTSIDSVGQASQQPTNVPISKCLVRAAAGVLADSRTDHVSETESEGVPVEDKPVVIPSANIGEVDYTAMSDANIRKELAIRRKMLSIHLPNEPTFE